METQLAYWSIKDLTKRYRCSSRTIYRWMQRERNKFPKPDMKPNMSTNLWSVDKVIEWEKVEISHTAQAS